MRWLSGRCPVSQAVRRGAQEIRSAYMFLLSFGYPDCVRTGTLTEEYPPPRCETLPRTENSLRYVFVPSGGFRAVGPGRVCDSLGRSGPWPWAHCTTASTEAPQSRCSMSSDGPSGSAQYLSPPLEQGDDRNYRGSSDDRGLRAEVAEPIRRGERLRRRGSHFLRSTTGCRASVTAEPLQQGRTQQLWLVIITDTTTGKVLARGQLRLQNVPLPE